MNQTRTYSYGLVASKAQEVKTSEVLLQTSGIASTSATLAHFALHALGGTVLGSCTVACAPIAIAGGALAGGVFLAYKLTNN